MEAKEAKWKTLEKELWKCMEEEEACKHEVEHQEREHCEEEAQVEHKRQAHL